MPKIAACTLLLCLFLTSIAFAKRSPPAEVAPLQSGDVEFRIQHSQMGCVEAWDLKHKELLWRKQIYVVKYKAGLEKDVQDVYITAIEVKDKALLIKNERQSEYLLDLGTLDVKVVKGAAVEGK